jgi:hypothetical protein
VMEPHTASKLKVNFGRAVSMCIYHVCSTWHVPCDPNIDTAISLSS